MRTPSTAPADPAADPVAPDDAARAEHARRARENGA